MTDIVETLRNLSPAPSELLERIGSEAANEIEKLREQLETAYMYGHDMAKAEYRHAIQEVEGENDRLRAALEKISTWPDHRLPSPRDIARVALEGK
jgi:hypothetical protein